MNMESIIERLAQELSVQPGQVRSAITLLDEGATVPFIARYRKEATDNLDDTQLRQLEERLRYVRELEERRAVMLNSIAEQDKLTPELEADIMAADTKTRLEDLYLPYKPKRRTKAQIAREAGLEPLALGVLENPALDPEQAAQDFINPEKGIIDTQAALEGARQILMERFAEDAALLGRLREYLWENALLVSAVVAGKEDDGAKYSDYFNYAEPIRSIPSHRALALFRGRNEDFLQISLREDAAADALPSGTPGRCERMVAERFRLCDQGRAADPWLLDCVRWAWRVKIRTHLQSELQTRLREAAEVEAIRVFAGNLHDLLLAAPAGPRATIGLDPGLRTGVKIAVIDATGKLLEYDTIYPHQPRNMWHESIGRLAVLAEKHRIELISIGNGTASRETDRLVGDVIKHHPELGLKKIVVSEAGASVYSASEFAAREFPALDVSIRGAVSIARRLQDPLAELVKIEPKAIGVGQYQHDVNQNCLADALDNVVEDCVNAVGVDVNTASAPLLSRISGLGRVHADNIVEYRNQNGPFRDRGALKKVPRIGLKTFEQAAGFLRIMNGDNSLDASAVHPEAYPIVERILNRNDIPLEQAMGNTALLRSLNPDDYIDDRFGVPTVTDIFSELEKPGRDPRPEFATAAFLEGVHELSDLTPDMILEGVVTNVTNFGAFVDIGVHQDGLVHISVLSDRYVKDPRDIVKAGDVVRVKVLDVDLKRRRIALSMRLQEQRRDHAARQQKDTLKGQTKKKSKAHATAKTALGSAFADAFVKAGKR